MDWGLDSHTWNYLDIYKNPILGAEILLFLCIAFQVSQVHCTEARRSCDEASDIEPIDVLDRPAAQLGRASTSDHPHRVDWTLVEGMDQPSCIDLSVELTALGVTRPNRPCVAVGPSIRGRQTRPPYAFQDEDSYTVQERRRPLKPPAGRAGVRVRRKTRAPRLWGPLDLSRR